VKGEITRRALLGQVACLTALGQTADPGPLETLRPAHPRLILPDADLDRIRLLIRDHSLARRVWSDLEKECDRLLSTPPVEYKFAGPRLQLQTRRAIDRITALSLVYRISKRDPWLRRAVMELNAAASFRDWNPSRFVETAEMTFAFAIGYDWLYNSLSPEERTWIREAIVTKGLDQALPLYQKQTGWTRERLNWNVVCNSAMGMGALAIAEDAPEKAAEVLHDAVVSIPHGLSSFGPDGGWPEGPLFGEFAARYASYFLASLDTALGKDFGLTTLRGLDRAGRFRVYSTGPTNKVFNYGDSPEEPGLAPEMFWLARRFNAPAAAANELKQLEKSTHPDAFDLALFERDTRSPQTPPPSLDAVFSSVSVVTFRSAWDDPNALFLAAKGGDNKASHAHPDLGTFVFDAGNIRWASDPGPDDSLPPGAPRNSSYRARTESHNTLLIDGENQDPKAEARITRQEFSPELSWAQIDLSKASPKVRQWTRRVGLAQRQAAFIQDSLRCDQPVEVIWGMMTDAEIAVNGPTATLHKNGWNVTAEIRSPRHAVFDVAPGRAGSANPKFRKLIVRLFEKVTELDLNIVLTPWRDGQTKAKISVQFPSA
jgi:hypothetical protein